MDVYNSYLLALVAHHFIILSTLTSKSLLFSKSPSKHRTMGPFLRYLAAGTPVSGNFRRLPLTRSDIGYFIKIGTKKLGLIDVWEF